MEAYVALSEAFLELGSLSDGVADYMKALESSIDSAEILNNMGTALQEGVCLERPWNAFKALSGTIPIC